MSCESHSYGVALLVNHMYSYGVEVHGWPGDMQVAKTHMHASAKPII